jgi:hypothetical protein
VTNVREKVLERLPELAQDDFSSGWWRSTSCSTSRR